MPGTKKKSMSQSKKQSKNSRKFENKSIGSKIQFWEGKKNTKSKRPTTKKKTYVKIKSKKPTPHPDSVVSVTTKSKSNKGSDFYAFPVGNQKSNKGSDFYAFPVGNNHKPRYLNIASKKQEKNNFNRDPSGVYAAPVNKIVMKSGERYIEKNGVQYDLANSGEGIRQTSPSYEEISTQSYLEPVKASTHKYNKISNNGTSYVNINNSNKPESSSKKPTSKKPKSGNKKPKSGNKKPKSGNKKLKSGSKKPTSKNSTNKKPKSDSKKPKSGSKKPKSGSKKPKSGSKKPKSGSKINKK